MKSLADIIDKCPGGINEVLTESLSDTFKIHGLVRTAKRGEELVNYNSKNNEEIVFIDDSYTHYLYHKLKNISHEQINSPGKKKLYKANASMSLICWSKNIGFCDHIINRLSQFVDITIGDIDNDSYKIIETETGKKDFDFAKFVFVVNYQLRYQTDNCNELCP